ncbi:MAG: alpha/beta hydrolase [Candidatus Moranbacteria bacterium]|nr:alpha/beta hydrolase [Candidatus Moranbacteria bacterium]
MAAQLKKHLQEFLTRLEKKYYLPFYTDGMSLGTDFRDVSVEVEPSLKKSMPILLLTGWGSGWEGILPLAFSLACLGYRVILISLPGYGESENPPPRYWRKDLCSHHSGIVLAVLQTFAIHKAYFIGHSMGAEVLAEAARINREVCEKLVLLHPSGLEEVGFFGKIALLWRFAASGIRLRKEYSRSAESQDDDLEVLINFCGAQKSPWWGRLRLRWAEFQEICRGGLLETLKRVPSRIIFLSGGRDTVYPPWGSFALIQQAVPDEKIGWNIIPGNHHNPTLFHPGITAKAIDDLLNEEL